MRKWLVFLILPLVLGALFYLPTMVSSHFFAHFVARAIEQKTGAVVTVGRCEFSWLGPQKFHQLEWSKSEVSGSLEQLTLDAPFWSFSGPFHLQNETLFFKGKQIDLIQAGFAGTQVNITGSHISLHGMFQSKRNFDLTVDIKELPAALLGSLFSDVLGETFSVSGSLRSLDSDLNLLTPNLQTRLIGSMEEGGFRIKTPLIAALYITEALLPHMTSQTPALFRIEPTLIPVPFSMERLHLEGTVDLGKLEYKNPQGSSSFADFLELDLSAKSELWFNKVDFSLKNQVLKLGRLDLLLQGSIHLCTWGEVHLHKDSLLMTLGIPASTLHKVFGINNLHPHYVLTAGVKGSLFHPEVEKKATLAKLTTLALSNRIPKRGVLAKHMNVGEKPAVEGEVPAPNLPFPWQK